MDKQHKDSIQIPKYQVNWNNQQRIAQVYYEDMIRAANILSGNAFKMWMILLQQQTGSGKEGFVLYQPYDYFKQQEHGGFNSPQLIKSCLEELKEKGYLIEFYGSRAKDAGDYFSWVLMIQPSLDTIQICNPLWDDNIALQMQSQGKSLREIAIYFGYSPNSKTWVGNKLAQAKQNIKNKREE